MTPPSAEHITGERKRNARKNAHEMHDYTRGDSREHITDERNEENLRAEPQSKTNKCPNEIRG
jgi:hypothetical protein